MYLHGHQDLDLILRVLVKDHPLESMGLSIGKPSIFGYLDAGFHKWGYPKKWMVFLVKNAKMDDDWGYPLGSPISGNRYTRSSSSHRNFWDDFSELKLVTTGGPQSTLETSMTKLCSLCRSGSFRRLDIPMMVGGYSR